MSGYFGQKLYINFLITESLLKLFMFIIKLFKPPKGCTEDNFMYQIATQVYQSLPMPYIFYIQIQCKGLASHLIVIYSEQPLYSGEDNSVHNNNINIKLKLLPVFLMFLTMLGLSCESYS